MNCRNCKHFKGYNKPCVIDYVSGTHLFADDNMQQIECIFFNKDNKDMNKNAKEKHVKEYLKSIPKNEYNEIIENLKNDNYDIDKYEETNKNIGNCFNIGDIVIFTWKPNYGLWCKGKIVANNFEMCNLPEFFGKPVYYITELDENDNVIDDKTSIAVDRDSRYIVKFEPGMEWCIGKSSSNNWPKVRDFEKEREDEMLDMKKNMRPFDMILVCINGKWEIDLFQQYINKDKTQIYTFKKYMILHDANWQPYMREDEDKHFRQLFNVDEEFVSTSREDSCESLGDSGNEFAVDIKKELPEQHEDIKLVTIQKNEELWKENIEKKLDDIDDKLNKLLLFQRTWTDSYPTYPWTPGTPGKPWYDTYKVYCETETETHETHNYTANIPLEDIHKYQETYSETNKLNNKK